MSDHQPVAVITGAGAGIGRACAIRFSREGFRIVIVDRTEADGRETVEVLKAGGAEALFVQADVASRDQCRGFAEAAVQAYGRIDVLVANAGIRVFGTLLEATEEDWDRLLAVNLKGVAFSCTAVLPQMIAQKSGALVLMGSTTALTGRPNMPLYDAAKFGVLSLTRSLAATHGKDGIRVNAVCPSFTLTEFHVRRAAAQGTSPRELRERNRGYGLLGRAGEPEDIAAAVHFLASADASFITGQYLIVDGGYSIGTQQQQTY